MKNLNCINVFYKGLDIERLIDGIKKEFNWKKNIIREDNIIKFRYNYTIQFHEWKIEFIDIDLIDTNKLFNLLINKENILLANNNLNKEIYNISLNKKLRGKCIYIDNKYIIDRQYINSSIIFKEILLFYIRRINDNLYNKGLFYISELNSIENIGNAVYNILSECSELYNQQEILINILSGEELYMDNLAYITDPILEYTKENSKVKVQNIVMDNMSKNFIVNILGVQ